MLSYWKSGRSAPKADKLKILADYFDVPIEYFLEYLNYIITNKLSNKTD
ncbi:helix-turn-helix domain-containing protein [Lachnospiraceae bacterium LCP25S3_G4]